MPHSDYSEMVKAIKAVHGCDASHRRIRARH